MNPDKFLKIFLFLTKPLWFKIMFILSTIWFMLTVIATDAIIGVVADKVVWNVNYDKVAFYLYLMFFSGMLLCICTAIHREYRKFLND